MKTNKLLIALLSLILLPALAVAQNWEQDATFVPQGTDTFFEVHGVAVDAEDKVWVASYYWNTEKIEAQRSGVDSIDTGAIYVYNADGTPASFSPLIDVEFADGSADTLYKRWNGESYEAMSGRGMEADANGDIVFSSFNTLYKIDHTNGKALAKEFPDIGSLTEGSYDDDGNFYITAVVGTEAPIIKYDNNLENPETVLEMTGGFSRDFQVAPDGNTIWWAGYTGPGVLQYKKIDQFSGFDPVPDTVLRGLAVESFDIHPKTGYLWVGSGSLNDTPEIPWTPQTWYAFDTATLEPGTTPTPVDSINWVPGADITMGFDNARPRGLDFSADGKTAYAGAFSGTETDVDMQVFRTEQVFVSNEVANNEIPNGYSLDQNYPNPFNPTTNIKYTINEAGPVTLKVYDMTGREVATLVNSKMNAGKHTVSFDAANLASGVYIYRLQSNGVRLTNKMTLIK